MPKKKIIEEKEQQVMYISEIPMSVREKDGKKVLSILKSKEYDFKNLMDKLNKENVNIRNIACNQIIRNVIHTLNLPVNIVVAELERLKFDLLQPIYFQQPSSNESKRSYLG